MGHVVHVQPARGDIGIHQHLEASFLKSAQGSVTLGLRAVAVNHRSSEAVPYQFLDKSLRAAFGPREDQRLSLFCFAVVFGNSVFF